MNDMFNLKDLDTSHMTSLHLVNVSEGSIYIANLNINDNNHDNPLNKIITDKLQAKTMPKTETKPSHSPMLKYFASEAEGTLAIEWLHQVIDKAKAKQKMLPLRALMDGDIISRRPDYEDVRAEFEKITKSTYYRWISIDTTFQPNEIDNMINAYSDWKSKKII